MACYLCQPEERGDIHRSEQVKTPHIYFWGQSLIIQAWQGVHKMLDAAFGSVFLHTYSLLSVDLSPNAEVDHHIQTLRTQKSTICPETSRIFMKSKIK